MTLDASVVICSRERPAMLLDTVRSVLAGDALPAEIVVIDQSRSPHAELASLGSVDGCRVRYEHVATIGVSRARNAGVRLATRDVVVLLDDDMFVEADWLEQLLAGRSHGAEPVIATGRVLAAPAEDGSGTVPAAALVTLDRPEVYRGRQPRDVIAGANVALPRALVLAVGGYDDRLGPGTRYAAADDNDLGLRLLDAGATVRHVPGAVVLHRAWRPRAARVRQRWDYGRGKGAFYAKHLAPGDAYIPRRIAAEVLARTRRAVGARTATVVAGELLAMAGMTMGALEWLVRERLLRR
jgi:GT2 family glycosyltransferase